MERITRYFFLSHIPITLLVDLSSWYPEWRIFSLPHLIRTYYLSSFNDPLISGRSDPGGWFKSLIFLEGVVQLPICFFVAFQYARQRQKRLITRIVIIAYSVQVMTATWACIFEAFSFSDLLIVEKASLFGFYAPYLIIPILMAYSNARAMFTASEENARELQYLRDFHSTNVRNAVGIKQKTILITGANSGVGFGIVEQLIDQHDVALSYRSLRLTLVLTVRDKSKARSVLTRLEKRRARFQELLDIDFVFMDLLSMSSIEDAAQALIQKYPTGIDSLICNAGMAQFSHIDLYKAFIQSLTHPVLAISEPNFKVQTVGGRSPDGLGATFQANFFGHYYLAKRLVHANVLQGARNSESSIVIWMSSLEATSRPFKPTDIQATTHEYAYESSKRLIDIMWSASNLGLKQYLVHPGFCSTNIIAETMHPAIVPLIGSLWTSVFYLARSLGSHFHTATAYNGAYAAAKVATDPQAYDASHKWGSAGNWDGEPMVVDTQFDEIDVSLAKRVVKEIEDLTDQWIRRLSAS